MNEFAYVGDTFSKRVVAYYRASLCCVDELSLLAVVHQVIDDDDLSEVQQLAILFYLIKEYLKRTGEV